MKAISITALQTFFFMVGSDSWALCRLRCRVEFYSLILEFIVPTHHLVFVQHSIARDHAFESAEIGTADDRNQRRLINVAQRHFQRRIWVKIGQPAWRKRGTDGQFALAFRRQFGFVQSVRDLSVHSQFTRF